MFFIQQNDNLPVVETLLSNSAGYIDISSATGAYFSYFAKGNRSGVATNQCSIVGPSSGYLRYTWNPSELTTGGFYYYRWTVFYSGSNKVSFPNDGYGMFGINSILN